MAKVTHPTITQTNKRTHSVTFYFSRALVRYNVIKEVVNDQTVHFTL